MMDLESVFRADRGGGSDRNLWMQFIGVEWVVRQMPFHLALAVYDRAGSVQEYNMAQRQRSTYGAADPGRHDVRCGVAARCLYPAGFVDLMPSFEEAATKRILRAAHPGVMAARYVGGFLRDLVVGALHMFEYPAVAKGFPAAS